MSAPSPDTYFRGNELDAARAIAAGDPTELERVLTFKLLNLRVEGEYGMTLLLFALVAHQPACLRLLLRWGADPNQATEIVTGERVQPVALAAECADVAQLRVLLDHGGDPNSLRRGAPALFGAIYASNWPALRLLAGWPGINLNLPKPDGVTPLLLLAYLNQYEQVAHLLAKGADFRPVADSGGTLAFTVQSANLDPNSGTHRQRQHVQWLLEGRGVQFPVPDPSVAWAKKAAAAQKLRDQWDRTLEGHAWRHRVNQAAAEDPNDDGVRLMHLCQAAQTAHEHWAQQQPAPASPSGSPP